MTANDYLICRSTEVDDYSVWRVDIDGDQRLHLALEHRGAKFDRKHQLISIGNFILEWGPITLQDYYPCFPFRLFKFDASINDPLGVNALSLDARPTLVMKGTWPKNKFWGTRPDFGNPEGPAKEYDKGEKLMLVPLGSYILNIIPTSGRGTFKLFYFDPYSTAPLPTPCTSFRLGSPAHLTPSNSVTSCSHWATMCSIACLAEMKGLEASIGYGVSTR